MNIADFGLSVYSEGFSHNYFSMRSGNVRWAAPELVAPDMYDTAFAANAQPQAVQAIQDGIIQTTRPSKQSDVYSFGCLCTEVSNTYPMGGEIDVQFLDRSMMYFHFSPASQMSRSSSQS